MLKSNLRRNIWSVVGFIIFAFFALGSTDSKETDSLKNRSMAYTMMKSHVESRLLSPGSAKYPVMNDNNVIELEDNKYRIISYVDSQNAYGAVLRTRFRGTIRKVNEYYWELISLEFVE